MGVFHIPSASLKLNRLKPFQYKWKQDIAITGGRCQSPRFSPGATWAGTKRPIPPIHQMKGSPCVFVNVQGVKKVVFHLFLEIFISQETTINPWGNSLNFMLSCWGNYSCHLMCYSASVDKGFGIFPYSLTLCINPLLCIFLTLEPLVVHQRWPCGDWWWFYRPERGGADV